MQPSTGELGPPCLLTAVQIPDSRENIDWHLNFVNRVVIDIVLTTTGSPKAPNQLPRSLDESSCRITVRMTEGVISAPVLWSDVKVRALTLVNHCVGGWHILAPA